MTSDKDKVFYFEKEHLLPFFFRYYDRNDLEEGLDNAGKLERVFDSFDGYGTRLSRCYLPIKPISKLLSYEDQKKLL